MLSQFRYIKYYAASLLIAFGFYAWASVSGYHIFGDDNENKDGHTVNSAGHGGGHGYFYHK